MSSPLKAPPVTPSQRFVRSAWAVLLAQLAAAAAAVAVTAWAAFQVRPLLAQRDRLAMEIEGQKARLVGLEKTARELSAEKERLSRTLANARESSHYVRLALEQYHNGRYAAAIAHYDQALELDPENAYVLDLKSYSQFRQGDRKGAMESIEAALRIQPDYVYGYSEWSRYACAAGRHDEARRAFDAARSQSPAAAEGLYRKLMREDGQFATLCAPLRSRFLGERPATRP